jgi:hypothetical protein
MNTFEKKLARYHEEQERKRRNKPMKHTRTKLIKSLEQQIEAATDPQLKADLSRQLTKVVTRPGRRGRPRKSEATPPSKKTWWAREIYTGSVFDAMSDVELMVHHIVLLCEKKKKVGECKTKAERDAVTAEVLGSLPESQRAAFEATLKRDGVA